MATMEDAAEELALKLREFAREVEDGQESLVSLGGTLDGGVKRLGDGWTSLEERVDTFLQRVNEQAGRLQEEVARGGQALADLQNGIATGESEAVGAVSAAASANAELEQHVLGLREPVHQATAEQVEAPLGELKERTDEVGAALEEALAAAREFLEREVPAALDASARQIRDAVQEACEGPLQQSAERLEQAYHEWDTMVGTIEGAVVECSFAAAPPHAREYVDYALGECGQAVEHALEQAREVAGLVEQALHGLREDVAARTAVQRQQAQEVLSNGHRDLLQALADSSRALDSVKGLLASFSFVRL